MINNNINCLIILFKDILRKAMKIKHSMQGKVVIVTVASAGIVKESTLDLARHDSQVILACRNEDKTKKVMQSLNEEEKN